MKKLTNGLVLCMFLLSMNCKNDDVNDLTFPINFEFILLDKDGKAVTSFKEGQDIEFVFRIINPTSESLNLDNFQPQLLCQTSSSFFRIYKMIDANTSKDMGRPCLPTACTLEGAYQIEGNSTKNIDYWWIKGCENNTQLSTGSYKTGFEYEFIMNGGKYDGLKAKKSFLVGFTIIQ